MISVTLPAVPGAILLVLMCRFNVAEVGLCCRCVSATLNLPLVPGKSQLPVVAVQLKRGSWCSCQQLVLVPPAELAGSGCDLRGQPEAADAENRTHNRLESDVNRLLARWRGRNRGSTAEPARLPLRWAVIAILAGSAAIGVSLVGADVLAIIVVSSTVATASHRLID